MLSHPNLSRVLSAQQQQQILLHQSSGFNDLATHSSVGMLMPHSGQVTGGGSVAAVPWEPMVGHGNDCGGGSADGNFSGNDARDSAYRQPPVLFPLGAGISAEDGPFSMSDPNCACRPSWGPLPLTVAAEPGSGAGEPAVPLWPMAD